MSPEPSWRDASFRRRKSLPAPQLCARRFYATPPCPPTPSALRPGQQTNLPLLRWFDARSMTAARGDRVVFPIRRKAQFKGTVPT